MLMAWTSVAALFAYAPAVLAATYTQTDLTTITGSDNTTYVDGKVDANHTYFSNKPGCTRPVNNPGHGINIDVKSDFIIQNGNTFTLYTVSWATGNCTINAPQTITVTPGPDANVGLIWSGGSITAGTTTFSQNSTFPDMGYLDTNGKCKTNITLDPGSTTSGQMTLRTLSGGNPPDVNLAEIPLAQPGWPWYNDADKATSNAKGDVIFDGNHCDVSAPFHVAIGGTPPAPGTTPAPTTGTGADQSVTCDAGGGFTWIICGIIVGALNFIDWVRDHVILPFLIETPLDSNDPNLAPVYGVWNSFRGVANVFFILIFILTIFGTAIGYDNYTIKKMLPRVVAAAILIQLSWYICAFMVDTGNILGQGLFKLMNDAIKITPPMFDITGSGQRLTAMFAGSLLLGVTGVVAVTSLSFTAIIMMVVSIIMVFFTLILRKLLILLLVVLAPLAFIFWILPNTEKLFKEWFDTLLKLILMYPAIVLLFEAGRLFAVVAKGLGALQVDTVTTGVTNTFLPVIQLVAYAIPLFLIPATFNMGGKAMKLGRAGISKIQGGANSQWGKNSDFGKKRAENKDRKSAYSRANQPVTRMGKLMQGDALNKATGGFSSKLNRNYAARRGNFGGNVITGGLNTQAEQKMYGVLSKQDKAEQDVYGRKYEYEDPKELQKIMGGDPKKYSINQQRAAAAALLNKADTNGMTEARNSLAKEYGATIGADGADDWTAQGSNKAGFDERMQKVIGSNWTDVKAKAPQVLFGDKTGFEEMTAGQQQASNNSTRKRQAAKTYGVKDDGKGNLSVDDTVGFNEAASKRLLENLDTIKKSPTGKQNWDSRTAGQLYKAAELRSTAGGVGSAEETAFKELAKRLQSDGQLTL